MAKKQGGKSQAGASQAAQQAFAASNPSSRTAQSVGRSSAAPTYSQPTGTPIVTQAPPRPSNIPATHTDFGTGQTFNTRFVPGAMMPGQAGYDPATGGGVWVAGGGTDEDLRAWYRSQDPVNTGGDVAVAMSGRPASAFSLDSLFGSGMTPSSTSAKSTNKASSYRDAKGIGEMLKIAGSTGGTISKQEIGALTKASDKSSSQLIQNLDRTNKRLRSRGRTGINLSSGAANMLINQAQKEPLTYDSLVGSMYGGKSKFGTGKIGAALQGMIGSRGDILSGTKATPGTGLMMGGTAIRPSGQPTVRGFGKKFEYTPTNKGVPKGGATTSTVSPETKAATASTTLSNETTPETPMAPDQAKEASTLGFGGIGADLSSWATGFRRKQSSRKLAGRQAQSLASTRVAPTSNVLGY